jgi:hypothetical protein
MAALLLTERRISAFGRSPAHLPAERLRAIRQNAHESIGRSPMLEHELR